MKRGNGDFSRITLTSIEYADTLQALALDRIRDLFASEEVAAPGMVDLRGVSLGDFTKALLEADANGTRDEFEADLSRQMAEAQAQQAAAQAAQQQQQGPQMPPAAAPAPQGNR